MENKLHHLDLLAYRLKDILVRPQKSAEDLSEAFQLFSFFFEKISENESVAFTTLFSRIAFITTKYKFPPSLIYDNHALRRVLQTTIPEPEELEKYIQYAAYILDANSHIVYKKRLSISVVRPEFPTEKSNFKRGKFQRIVKGILLQKPVDVSLFEYVDREQAHVPVSACIENEDFKKQFNVLIKNIPLPANINLVDVNIGDDGVYKAQAFVVEPNFMVGVTSISECFQNSGSFALKYMVGKLVPTESSVHMLIGNIVNYFLDELVHDPDREYKDIIKSTFRLAPEAFSLLSDAELKNCLAKVGKHYSNLQKVVKNELLDAGITKDKAYLEPSFYSNEYGISGRLDLYHYSSTTKQSDIVELKSGKLFKANSYGLNENHFIQTLLYDLIIESLYKGKVKSSNYILYSFLDKQRLRYAPRVRAKQYEAMLIRNDIMMIEYILTNFDEEKYNYLTDSLSPENIPAEFTFVKRESEKLAKGLRGLSKLELCYYKTFVAFLSREYRLSKIGEHGIHKSNGMASLWLDPINEKIKQFTLLSNLVIKYLDAANDIPIVVLNYSDKSNKLSKFRFGDIAVLYPYSENQYDALNNQIFKCTILKIDNEEVHIRLRARQKNEDIFHEFKYWNIEPDVLDSGFNKQFHSLFEFINSHAEVRAKLLNQVAPAIPIEKKDLVFDNTTVQQTEILNKAIRAIDYFLLWGPPGTGKTSIMIKNLVSYYFRETGHNILLLAYTNRAVDEICAAIEEVVIGNFVRLGSRYSCDPKFESKLFNLQAEQLSSRKELLEFLNHTRVFVSTVSSFQSKKEISQLKQFDLVIIDEASQLLEPMLVGLLSGFKKYILIGDHKQLPAVVSQNKRSISAESQVVLSEINFEDCGTSLFERMFKNCVRKNWEYAYGILSYQGRMHEDILKFVSKEFYEGSLKLLPGMDRLRGTMKLKTRSQLQKLLVENRMLFVNTELDQDVTTKANATEAKLVATLVEAWIEIYDLNEVAYDQDSLGIITPFRAQIARLKESLALKGIEHPFTIDTIERYQGGSRDQIIISLAVNQADLLDSITNISDEGIDRKLNVALTRAKEHIIIFGTKEVLTENKTYKNLIEYCTELTVQQIVELQNSTV